jgi:hypothetical protein
MDLNGSSITIMIIKYDYSPVTKWDDPPSGFSGERMVPVFFCIVAWVPEISGRIILKQLNL